MNYKNFLIKYKYENNLKKTLVVYTVIFGNYDKLKKINFLEKNIDYVCFTDQNIKDSTWKIIKVDTQKYNKVLLARIFKFNPHIIFSSFEKSIFIDGSIKINCHLTEFVNKYAPKSKIALFKHPTRNCVYKEIAACKILKKDNSYNLNNIKKFLIENKYPYNNGLLATGLVFRYHNLKDIIEAMEYITELTLNYTLRDQLIFYYVLSKKNIDFSKINLNIFNNKYIDIIEHDNNKIMFLTKLKYFIYKNIFKL